MTGSDVIATLRAAHAADLATLRRVAVALRGDPATVPPMPLGYRAAGPAPRLPRRAAEPGKAKQGADE